MNKKTKLLTIIGSALISIGLSTVVIVSAVSGYDPSTDPLVTKSYVDDYVNKKIMSVDSSVKESISQYLETELEKTDIASDVAGKVEDELYGKIYDKLMNEIDLSNIKTDNSYEQVELAKDQKLIATGCTELILRSGTATVITVEDGLSDLDFTAGIDLASGEKIPANHYIIIPKSDGRGIMAMSDGVVVLVRGKYEIR